MNLRIVSVLLITVFVFLWMPKNSPAEYGDIILNKNAKFMREAGVKDVLFSHRFHRMFFKCKVCHEKIFIMKAGANDINMNRIVNGEKCGMCHNETLAWGPLYCDQCHSHAPPQKPDTELETETE